MDPAPEFIREVHWDQLIADHFDAVAALQDAIGDVDVPKTFEDARPHLPVRIHPDGYLAEAGLRPEAVVQRVDLPCTRTILILDGDETALVVPRSDVLCWGQDPDNVLAVAFANTRRAHEQDVEVTAREFEGIGTLHVVRPVVLRGLDLTHESSPSCLVDYRPSDALALAAQLRTPIFVAQGVLDNVLAG